MSKTFADIFTVCTYQMFEIVSLKEILIKSLMPLDNINHIQSADKFLPNPVHKLYVNNHASPLVKISVSL